MTMRALLVAVLLGAATLSTGAGDAHAQPWAQGVTEAQKAEAQKRLEEGNSLFLAQKYKEALEKYQEAITSWDHPAIRFNVVRCLIWLDRPVEASDNLQLALKYGAEPLEDAVYAEALQVQKLLASQIGDLEVNCKEPGATLTLDGQPFITCPGQGKRRVAPGSHGLVATKKGFLTKEMQVVVVGGKAEMVDIKMVPLAKAAKVVHRWPTWIPWVVFGGGLAVTGMGVYLQVQAQNRMNDFDNQVAQDCSVTGCDLSMEQYAYLQDDYDSAKTQNRIAVGVISVGAVGAAVGGVLLFMNRGRTVYEDPFKATGPMVNVTPTRDGGGLVSLSGRF